MVLAKDGEYQLHRLCEELTYYIEDRQERNNPRTIINDHNREIRTRKQRTDVGKYSFVKTTIKSWKQLSAGLLASFPCKPNTFRKSIKNVVTSKGIQVRFECK